jgi:multidrug efflux pump subunit AcrA (membrane-fusion protein)
MKKQFFVLISILGILSMLLAACGGQPATPAVEATPVPIGDVIAEGNIRPVLASDLSFQARGIVDEIKVEVGDSVQEGDVLVRLSNAGAAEAQLLTAKNAYDLLLRNEDGERAKLWQAYMDAQDARGLAENKWDDLNVENIEDRIEDSEDEVEDRQLDLDREKEDFAKFEDLPEEDDERENAEDDLETAQENLNESIRELESITRERDEILAAYNAALAAEAEARYQYEITLDGPNADQLALAKANLDAAQDMLDGYVLTAPFDGIVVDLAVAEGEQVGPEARIVSVADLNSWIVETSDVTELEVVKISEGQPVFIHVDALPDVTLDGQVTTISASSILQGGDVLYTVRIHVEEIDPRVRWGMTVEVRFPEVTE